MFAAMQNHPHSVNELLSHGADFTKSDFNGETALSLAVQNGSKLAQRVLESHILSVLKGMVSGKDSLHDWTFLKHNLKSHILRKIYNSVCSDWEIDLLYTK